MIYCLFYLLVTIFTYLFVFHIFPKFGFSYMLNLNKQLRSYTLYTLSLLEKDKSKFSGTKIFPFLFCLQVSQLVYLCFPCNSAFLQILMIMNCIQLHRFCVGV